MKLIILRHGEPEHLCSGALMSSVEFREWVRLYNEAPLSATSLPGCKLKELADQSGLVVCSSLRRSVESAQLLESSSPVMVDGIFVEAGLPVNSWPGIKMSSTVWLTILRILWMLGYSHEAESRIDATSRASKAALILDELSNKYGVVLLVGHGIFNRLLGRALKKNGWKVRKSSQSEYWSYAIYEI